MLKEYEKQLIEGLTQEEQKHIINTVNAINKICGLQKFGE